jgi:hypothetical protein
MNRARKAQLRAWNEYMQATFWSSERFYPSGSLREEAFDTLVGDNANHGIAPP